MRENVTFRIASVTKTFTAAAMLRLHEQGLLDLEAPIAGFLPPELVNRLSIIDGENHGAEITVEQLLQHTAGLRDPDSARYVERMMREPRRRWTPREQIEQAVQSGPPYNRPGAAARYSNTGYIVASLLIEEVSGAPLAEAFRSLLRFDDLHLATVHLESLEAVPEQAGERMVQYFGDYDIAALDASIDLYGGGGLVSDARNLCGFWRALFGGHVFDAQTTLERMCTTVPGPDRDVGVGLGLFRHRLNGHDVWLHTGFWGIIVFHAPDLHLSVAAATNQAASHLPHGALFELGRALFELALDA